MKWFKDLIRAYGKYLKDFRRRKMTVALINAATRKERAGGRATRGGCSCQVNGCRGTFFSRTCFELFSTNRKPSTGSILSRMPSFDRFIPVVPPMRAWSLDNSQLILVLRVIFWETKRTKRVFWTNHRAYSPETFAILSWFSFKKITFNWITICASFTYFI